MTTSENIKVFKNLSEHDQKEVLKLIKLKNEFKKQEIERKAKAYDELIDYLKEKINLCNRSMKIHKKAIAEFTNINEDNRHLIRMKILEIEKEAYEEILNRIEKW